MRKTSKQRDSTPKIKLKPKLLQWLWQWLFKLRSVPPSSMTNQEKNPLSKTLTLILQKLLPKSQVVSQLGITLFKKWLREISNSIWSHGTQKRNLIIWKPSKRDQRPKQVSNLLEKFQKSLSQGKLEMFFLPTANKIWSTSVSVCSILKGIKVNTMDAHEHTANHNI